MLHSFKKSFIETLITSCLHADRGGLPLAHHHTPCLCTRGERLRSLHFILQTRRPLAEALGLLQIKLCGLGYFTTWRFPLNERCSKPLHFSETDEDWFEKKKKKSKEYNFVEEWTVGCTQSLSARCGLFRSNNNAILYSGHMWLAHLQGKQCHASNRRIVSVIAIYIIQTGSSWADLWKREAEVRAGSTYQRCHFKKMGEPWSREVIFSSLASRLPLPLNKSIKLFLHVDFFISDSIVLRWNGTKVTPAFF